MRKIASQSPLTTVAIGGINEENLASVLMHGVSNFAVVRAVCASHEPRQAIQRLMKIWRETVQDQKNAEESVSKDIHS